MNTGLHLRRTSCGTGRETLALEVRQRLHIAVGSGHDLVGIIIQSGQHADVLIGTILEAALSVQSFIGDAGDGKGNLSIAGLQQIQILNAAVGSLHISSDVGQFGVPEVRDSRAERIESARRGGGREANVHALVVCGLRRRHHGTPE